MFSIELWSIDTYMINYDLGTPLVSIVVPVYNVEEYLSRCIDSLRYQSYKNLEILLVDDGSIDLSGSICDDYAIQDSRIRVFHKTNSGVSAARNLALDNVRGEYITFVDSDDWLDGNWVENALCELKKADVLLYIGGYVKSYLNSEDKITHKYLPRSILTRNECMKEMYTKSIIETCFVWEVCGKLFHKSLWESIRFSPDISSQEDGLAFWQVLQLVDKVVYVPAYNYHYFFRDSSAVNSLTAKHIYDDFCVNKILCDESVRIDDSEIRHALKARFFNSRINALLALSGFESYADFVEEEKHILYQNMLLHFLYIIRYQRIKGIAKFLLSCLPSSGLRCISKIIAKQMGIRNS